MPRSILFVAPLLAAGGGHAFTPPPRQQQWADYAPSLAAAYRDSDAAAGEIRSGSRRGAILAGLGGALSSFVGRKADAADGATVQTAGALLADFPMRRLHLPKGGLGREYVIIQLYIKGKGPFDFMVDSGLTTEMITPLLSQELGLGKAGVTMQGLSAGASQTQSLVDLDDAALCCNSVSKGEVFKLPPNLKAIVTDFPQEHLDPAINVEGMLGMELLEQFDVDFDFPKGRLRLYRPGTVGSVAKKDGLAKIDAVVVNETRLLGIRVVPASAPRGGDAIRAQPFLGVVDCGASFSVVNGAAAPLLGLPAVNDPSYKNSPQVAGMGVDGRSIAMPTANIRLSYVGNPVQDKTQRLAFEAPPSSWEPWDGVLLAIGDLPIFSSLLGDGKSPYQGPAGIIGLDILSQRRLVLETSGGRQRKIYVG